MSGIHPHTFYLGLTVWVGAICWDRDVRVKNGVRIRK